MSIHVWRQAQTQSTINNFYEEDMNIFKPRRNARGNSDGVFRMEFPIMQWFIACLYKIFGNHLLITRLFMFVTGLVTVIGIYRLLDELFNQPVLSAIGAWAFNFSPGFYYYTINPLPDNFALCFSVWGLVFFFMWYKQNKLFRLLISSLLLSIGTLSKLPFIIYYIVPVTYFIDKMIRNGVHRKDILSLCAAISFSLLPITWYLMVIPQWNGNVIVHGMLNNQDSVAKLFDYYQHNLISTLPEILIGYGSVIFFLAGFYFLVKNKAYQNPKFLPLAALGVMAIVYYLFEANAIARVHDYYLFPFYPILFILVAYGAFQFYTGTSKFKRYLTYLLLLAIPVSCYLRMQGRWNNDSPGFNKDLLTYKTELQNAVPKDALVIAGNDDSQFVMFYYIDKKGWGFDNDQLTPEMLRTMIDQGAQYLYSDSEKINNNLELSPYFDALVLQKGSFRIYSLKKTI
ncbi:MAG TPA: glycosyltransferase family 39 protein [Bacteroidia bacterium]|nr:glycosyltransferase family 39 protein [Bacteroidia bacterium]HNP98376.1 glycosyltransferase family 39 protein [Bacteroidia bacterium]